MAVLFSESSLGMALISMPIFHLNKESVDAGAVTAGKSKKLYSDFEWIDYYIEFRWAI